MKDEISKKFYEKYLKQKNNRLPNIIISGVKKCGTKGKTHFSPICEVNNFSFIFSSFGISTGTSQYYRRSKESVYYEKL